MYAYSVLDFTAETMPVESFSALSIVYGVWFLVSVLLVYLAIDFVFRSIRMRKLAPFFQVAALEIVRLNKWFVMVIIPLGLIFTMSLSAMIATSQASLGRKIIGKPVQRVFLVAPRLLSSIKELERTCDVENNCVYGPFGFVAETPTSFYLIKWRQQEKQRFQQVPGLYIMPRNDLSGAYYIIPATTQH
jgi:hypothetical protein